MTQPAVNPACYYTDPPPAGCPPRVHRDPANWPVHFGEPITYIAPDGTEYHALFPRALPRKVFRDQFGRAVVRNWDPDEVTASQIAEMQAFLIWANTLNPQFANRIKELLRSHGFTQFGDATASFNTFLSDLNAQLQSIATSLSLSQANYVDAATRIKWIQEAGAAGIPVDMYIATKMAQLTASAGNTVANAAISNASGSSVLGIPTWLLIGGAVVAVLLVGGKK